MIANRTVRVFTWINAIVFPLLAVILMIALLNDSDFMKREPRSIAEYAIMLLLFYTVPAMPVTATVCLLRNRHARSRGVFLVNGIALFIWSFVFIAAVISAIVR